jgi:uncharacterized membrane-anchored protein
MHCWPNYGIVAGMEIKKSAASIVASKVPAVTLAFWIVKICATTLGETGGDAFSMTLNLGYLVATGIFLGFFAVTLTAQLSARRYHPLPYWLVVVATTTVGTTTSDYLDRTAGLGYPKASALLLGLVILTLVIWRLVAGHIAVDHVYNRRDETFYWITILISNTLGTALGDFTADSANMGFERGALIFSGLLVIVALLHFFTRIPKPGLFWAAYVLTRPLGATLGDTLTKPHALGGLNLGRFWASGTIAVVMIVLIAATSLRKPAEEALDS